MVIKVVWQLAIRVREARVLTDRVCETCGSRLNDSFEVPVLCSFPIALRLAVGERNEMVTVLVPKCPVRPQLSGCIAVTMLVLVSVLVTRLVGMVQVFVVAHLVLGVHVRCFVFDLMRILKLSRPNPFIMDGMTVIWYLLGCDLVSMRISTWYS